MYSLLRPALFCLDAEKAHAAGLRALDLAHRTGTLSLATRTPVPLPTRAFGLEFPNPVGLAAGLDKNGEHIDALFALGFGYVEIGTITPHLGARFPPAFVSSGTHDPLAPQAHALVQRMAQLGLDCDSLFFAPDSPPSPHEFQFDLDSAAGQQCLRHLTAFLARHSAQGPTLAQAASA